jgi:hypothetical protein
LHIDLDEGAGELFIFPRSACFARAQANEDILPPHRLAGMQSDVLDDAVALVEDSEHRDALRHRRHPGLADAGRCRGVGDGHRAILRLIAPAARGDAQHKQQRNGEPGHAYSGIHGS